jgi:hypothetical protein
MEMGSKPKVLSRGRAFAHVVLPNSRESLRLGVVLHYRRATIELLHYHFSILGAF